MQTSHSHQTYQKFSLTLTTFKLFELAKKITNNIGYFVPRNANIEQVREIACLFQLLWGIASQLPMINLGSISPHSTWKVLSFAEDNCVLVGP